MSADDYRLGYRSDIEGLRAVAILSVVAAHARLTGLAGGFVGVDVFFVLSGFLITGLLMQEIIGTGRLRFADFYVRRLRRLLPALMVMLLVVGAVAALLLGPGEQIEQAPAAGMAALWLSNIYFAFNQLDYFAQGSETNLFLHTWSLGVEEQFYLLWPALLLWLLGRDGRRNTARLKLGMFVIAAASLLACCVLTYRMPQLAFYMMPLRAWQFSAGALIWLFLKSPRTDVPSGAPLQSTGTMLYWAGWIGLGMIVAAGVLFNAAMPYPGLYALLPTAGAVLVIASGTRETARGVARVLSLRPLQALGRISYSWYLWHWPILLLGHVLTGSDSAGYRVGWLALSLLLAVISYRLVEAPIRHQPSWLLHKRRVLWGAFSLVVATDLLAMHWFNLAAVRMEGADQQRYSQAHADAPAIYGLGCDDWYHSDQVHICAFGPADAPHTAVLMGDSIAGQWFPAFARAFKRTGWRLLVVTKSSCPMVDVPFFYVRIGREYTECSTWRRSALDRIAAIRPDLVVLSTVWTNDFSQAQWIDGTARVLTAISPAAGHIFVLRGTPHLPFDGPDCLAEHEGRPAWLGLSNSCRATAIDQHAEQVYGWLQQAASRFSNASTLDMNALVCPNDWCDAQRQGVVVFRDSQHMTATFAASLAPALEQKLGLEIPRSTDPVIGAVMPAAARPGGG